MGRRYFILGMVALLLGWGCSESSTVLGPGETEQPLIINFGGGTQPRFPDARSVLFISNTSVDNPEAPVRVTDVRFSTLMDEVTCEVMVYQRVTLNEARLASGTVPTEPCTMQEQYTLRRLNDPLYGPVSFSATNAELIQDVTASVPLLSENLITNIAPLQVLDADQDLVITFKRPVDPVHSKLYLFEAILGQPETLTVRFTRADDHIAIPREQLQRLRSMSRGPAFTLKLQETRIEQGLIPIRDLEGNLLSLIDVWNANAHTLEVILR
jgi:hypothetical protein